MLGGTSNSSIALGLVVAVILWGGNNVGLKFVVTHWPPLWSASSRFLCAGALLFALLHGTRLLGSASRPTARLQRDLWLRGGLSLAVYMAVCVWTLRFIPSSHFALHLAAAPVWALIWEGLPGWTGRALQRLAAALLAFAGVLVLLWPALRQLEGVWFGELLGLASSLLWTNYSRECKRLAAAGLSGVELTAHTMWKAGVWLAPLAALELAIGGLDFSVRVAWVQLYCITLGGVAPFALWNHALRHWPPSRAFLFSNLAPLTTMAWAGALLGERLTPTFAWATLLIVAGVLLGQVEIRRVLGKWWVPEE